MRLTSQVYFYSVFIWTLFLWNGVYGNAKKGAKEKIKTVLHWAAKLPCRVQKTDAPLLILWYREDQNHPFYSYDVRNTSLAAGNGRIHDQLYGPRSYLLITQENFQDEANRVPSVYPGYLILTNVSKADEGLFRCRVEFVSSPTQTHWVEVVVHEPLSSVTVIDGRNQRLVPERDGSLTVGPLDQGASLLLTCIARGGFPQPIVEWWKEKELLSPMTVDEGDGSWSAKLFIPAVTRQDLNRHVTCKITSSELLEPNITTVKIEMNLQPIHVEILYDDEIIKAGSKQELICRSKGSHPAANLTWTMESRPGWKPTHIIKTGIVDDMSESRILWDVFPEDDGQKLTCTASNPRQPNYRLSYYMLLNVSHPPISSLMIGRELDAKNIREGADVYFTCQVRANPKITSIQFFHEDTKVEPDQVQGILVLENSLVLQKVRPQASGSYSCLASNAIGSSKSNSVRLEVLYSPRCQVSSQIQTAKRGENSTVECIVDAFPPPTRFTWSVNTSQGPEVIPREQFTNSGLVSTLMYPAPGDLKKLELQCWALNSVGQQSHPCLTTLIGAGVPERPKHCSVVEQSGSSLRVTCIPGHDGGLDQHFLAKIVNPTANEIVVNVTSDSPKFTVNGLTPGFGYVVYVYAINPRGRSHPFVVEGFYLKVAENRMDSGTSLKPAVQDSPFVAIIIGVLAAFVLTFAVIIAATRLLCHFRKNTRRALVTRSESPPPPAPETTRAGHETVELLQNTKDYQKGQNTYSSDPAREFLNLKAFDELDSKNQAKLFDEDNVLHMSSAFNERSSTVLSSTPSLVMDSPSGCAFMDSLNRSGTSSTWGKQRSRPTVSFQDPSPTSSTSLLLPSKSGGSYSGGQYLTVASSACTRRPDESFV